jgi:hypothetical protein
MAADASISPAALLWRYRALIGCDFVPHPRLRNCCWRSAERLWRARLHVAHIRSVFRADFATMLARWLPPYQKAKEHYILNAVLMTG